MSDLSDLILERYALDRHNIDEWADEAERVERPGSKNEAAWLVRELWRERLNVERLREALGQAAILTDDGSWSYPKEVKTAGPKYVCDKCGATPNYHFCPACGLFLEPS